MAAGGGSKHRQGKMRGKQLRGLAGSVNKELEAYEPELRCNPGQNL